MQDHVRTLERIYAHFNERNIDGVLIELSDDVAWANGMDGGHVVGHEALRRYWERQWSIVSPHVEPQSFHQTEDDTVMVEVRQTVRDLDGNPLQGQAHGLHDKTVRHIFRLRGGQIVRFDIEETV